MAAAIIPVVLGAVQLVAPLIPGIITGLEGVFGAGNGAAKKQAAVDLLKSVLGALANVGKVPSAGVVDPSLPAALGSAVQTVFDSISVPAPSGGKIPALPTAPAVAPVAPTVSGSVVSMQVVKLVPGQGLVIMP